MGPSQPKIYNPSRRTYASIKTLKIDHRGHGIIIPKLFKIYKDEMILGVYRERLCLRNNHVESACSPFFVLFLLLLNLSRGLV